MIFREATVADIPVLSRIRSSVRENALSDPTKITPQMYQEYLTRLGKGWLCEIDGMIVGFSVASGNDSSIWALFVGEEYEGRGIGKRLLRMAVEWLAGQGNRMIYLSTDPDTRADHLYRREGWVRGDLRPDGEVEYRFYCNAEKD